MAFLSEEVRGQILAYLPRYPSKQAVTLPALHIVHDALRCVPREAIKEIADILDLSPAEVYDTMSFYQFFREEKAPQGRTRLWVCRSLACSLRGGENILARLCQILKVEPGGTTADGKFSLEFAECLGACEGAPSMLVDDVKEFQIRTDSVEKIISWLHNLRGTDYASGPLIENMRRKGRTITYAEEGTDERRNLQMCDANALYLTGHGYNHIVLRVDARKIEALEEFLHGTQERLGILKKLDGNDAEKHVIRFMIRHQRLLGISLEDVALLGKLLKRYEDAGTVSYAD